MKRCASLIITIYAIVLLVCLPANASDFLLGVTTHLMNGLHTKSLAVSGLKTAGFNSFREDFFWHKVEVKKGTFLIEDPQLEYASLLDSSTSLAVTPLVILSYGSKHYEGGDFPISEESLSAFKKYVEFVVRRVNNKTHLYQVWNEWNIGLGLPTKIRRNGSSKEYLKLLRSVVPVIRAIDPNAVILGTSVARMDETWIQNFVSDGGLQLIDGFSLHPYVWASAKSRPADAIAWVDKIQLILKKNNSDHFFPIYITEIGWPNHKGNGGVSESRASAYAGQFTLLAKSRSWIKGVWWYDLMDDGPETGNWEHNFGLFRLDGNSKPIINTFAKLSSTIINGKFVDSNIICKNISIMRFSLPNGNHVTSLWSNSDLRFDVKIRMKAPFQALFSKNPAFLDAGLNVYNVTLMPMAFLSTKDSVVVYPDCVAS